jgi:predicted O-linked N-acetylglucosamine transferase (SPINDLY family)
MTTNNPKTLTPDAALRRAIAHQQAGRLQDAEQLYRAILQVQPFHPDANHNLGVLAGQAGQHAAGLPYLKTALTVNPTRGQYLMSYADALQALGKLDDALANYRRALEIKPEYAEARNNLGVVLQALGQLDDAVASYRRALEIEPDFAHAHCNLGNALQALAQLDDAVASYRRALEIKPDYAEAHYNLGIALQALGQLDDAVASYRRALKIKPDFAEAHSVLGNALQALGQLDDAVASYRRALAIKPEYAEAHNNLGVALQALRQLDDAVASYRRALAIKPDYAEAHYNLGNALRELGQLDDAVASYRRALAIKPDYAEAYSNLLFVYGYNALIDPHQSIAQARTWEQACLRAQDRQAARHRDFQPPPLADRRLKVGYVSGDFRQHAVSYFVEQLFTQHDRTRVELFAYSTLGQCDAVTQRLQALVEHWVPLAGIPNAAIRERIESDGIDVLIDLSGHTMHNRLGAFARRAAPVQAHYLGYFASTGLTEMDYWIGDEILTPVETDCHFSERVWRLPRVWVSYDGKADAPVADWRPSPDGAVWLGSFNNLGKLTPATLALWAKALHALPEGKLLLKTRELSDIANRRRILDAMSGHGISPDRVELQDSSATQDWSAHMAYYDRLDIALDPVGGVNGGTTTCDALWMGAPVIALEGDRMASRMTTSMLNAIGRPEWVARSEADYIDKVVALARDMEQRKALRASQRKQIAFSPLCDARGLAVSLEDAYEAMFDTWWQTRLAAPGNGNNTDYIRKQQC